MGLDSRIVSVPCDGEGQRLGVELQNWRGHELLNDWMMKLYLRKGKESALSEKAIMKECGFCVWLDAADLEELDVLMRENSWLGVSGDLGGIAKAKAEILKGNAVLYSADW